MAKSVITCGLPRSRQRFWRSKGPSKQVQETL